MTNLYFSEFRENLKSIREKKLPESSCSKFPFVPKSTLTRKHSDSYNDFVERYQKDATKHKQSREEASLKEVIKRKA